MAALSLRLLGPLRASYGDTPLDEFRTKKVQALLIYLAAEPEPQRWEVLMELLWPGLPERSARGNLRQILYLLRQALPEVARAKDAGMASESDEPVPLLSASRQVIRLNPAADMVVDTIQLEALLDKSGSHDHLDVHLCPDCRHDLTQAVALYRGDFLSDFYIEDSNEFEEWAFARREYFRRRALDALTILTDIAIRQQSYSRALELADRQLEIDNLREGAYRQKMEALALNGRREEALGVYEGCRLLLQEELAMAPSARTTEFYEQILAGDLQFGVRLGGGGGDRAHQ